MKLKKTLLTLGLAGTGLVGLTIGLPILLTSCSNQESDTNPISFKQIQQPVEANKELQIVANVNNLNNYNVTWSYCVNNNNQWIGIKNGITNTSNSSTLTINAQNVTVALNNVVFKLTITNKDTNATFSASTSVEVKNPEFTDAVNPNIKISVNGNSAVTANKPVTITASATCNEPNITNFGYQWYYQAKPTTFKFFNNSSVEKATSPIDGWTSCGSKANTNSLVIPEDKVTADLTNYQFMVVVYDSTNNKDYNVSAPISITLNALGDIPIGSMMNNVVTDVTNSFTSPESLKTQVTPNPNPLITSATANSELVNKIGTALGLNPDVIQNVEISLGNNLLKEYNFWNGDVVSLNIVVTLKDGYSFGSQQTANGCNNGINNTQATITFENNTLTISNIQTKISNLKYKEPTGADGNTPSPQLQELAKTVLGFNWNGFDNITGVTVTLNQQTLPLFEAFAKYLNVDLGCIASIGISGSHNVSNPSESSYNTMYFTLQLKGIDVSNCSNDGSTTSNGSNMQENGNWILEFQLTDCPNQ